MNFTQFEKMIEKNLTKKQNKKKQLKQKFKTLKNRKEKKIKFSTIIYINVNSNCNYQKNSIKN